MPDLPVEIWFEIASLLSESELERLLGLNKVFLEVALNRRYGEVSLGPWFLDEGTKVVQKYLKHLSDPFVASRIQKVCLPLRPGLLKAPNPSDDFHAFVDRLLDHIRPGRHRDKSLLRRSRSALGVDPRAIKLFSKLRNVQSLVLTEYIYGDYSTPPIVALSWDQLGHNLRELDIRARPQKAADLLSSAPDLPNLETFSLEFKRDPYYLIPALNDVTALGEIPRFIRRLAPTIRQLKVVARTGKRQLTFQIVASLVLKDVGRLPGLERFLFDVSYDEAQGYGWPASDFFHFLKENNQNLRHLTVPPIPGLFQRDPSSSRVFCPTKLESFTLLPSSPSLRVQDSIDAAKAYIQSSRETLTSIRLLDQYLYVSELEEILAELPSFPSPTTKLRHLSINIVALGPDILDLLAEGLPDLTHLTIFFTSVVFQGLPEPPHPVNTTAALDSEICSLDLVGFQEDMKARAYQDWSLSTLSLGKTASEGAFNALANTLRESIPALKHVYSVNDGTADDAAY